MFGVIVLKASASRSAKFGCNGTQGIYAQLRGGNLPVDMPSLV